MHRTHALIATIATLPAAVAMALAAPASADDLYQQVCSAISQQSTHTLQDFLKIDRQLMQQGHRHDFDSIVHQSVANDCPQYQGDLAQADRVAEAANGNIMGCPPGMTYVPSLGRCRDY